MAALHDGIGEMCCANHHPTDVARHCGGLLQQLLQGGHNPTGDVSRGGRFDPPDDLLALHQHSVGVRAAYVNAYTLLHRTLLFADSSTVARRVVPYTLYAQGRL